MRQVQAIKPIQDLVTHQWMIWVLLDTENVDIWVPDF